MNILKKMRRILMSKRDLKDYTDYIMEYDGSLACDCDHGCRQWIYDNRHRTGLFLEILKTKGSVTNLDKLAQMDIDRVNKIHRRILSWKSEKFNRELRGL